MLSRQIHAAFQSSSSVCSTAGGWEQGREEQPAVFFGRKCGNTFFQAASCFVNVWFECPNKCVFSWFPPQKVDSRCNLKDSFQLSLAGNQKCPSSWIKHSNSLLQRKLRVLREEEVSVELSCKILPPSPFYFWCMCFAHGLQTLLFVF